MIAHACVADRPWLLCINLQREYATPGRPLHAPHSALIVARAQACLSRARQGGWRIAHVQARPQRLANEQLFARPIEGLEPSPSEPVFRIEQRSALSHVGLCAQLREARPRAIYLVGFCLAHEGLATLFQATDLGLPARVVEGAAGSHAIGDRSAAEIDRMAFAVAASMSALASCQEVMNASPRTLVRLRGGNNEH